MSKMILLCAEESAPVTLIDPALGKMVRKSEGLLFTDDVSYIKEEGDYLWVADKDATIACFTKDLVTIASRDFGQYSQTSAGKTNMFYLRGNFLYVLNTRKRDGGTNAYDPAYENQLTIIKYDKYTLEYVSEVVLSNALFWDDTGKASLLDSSDYVWTGDHVWVKSAANWDRFKIALADGSLADTWTQAGGAPQWTGNWCSNDGSHTIASFHWFDPTLQHANFVTKTVHESALALSAAAAAAGAFPVDVSVNSQYDDIAGQRGNMPYVDEANHKLYFVVHAATDETNAVYKYYMVALDLFTGAATFSPGVAISITPPDADKLPVGMTREYNYFAVVVVVSPTLGYAFSPGMTALINFTTGVVTPILVGPMQSYADNGVYWTGTMALEIAQVPLSGTVERKDTHAPIVGLSVFLMDQDGHSKIAETKTDSNGVYTFQKYTSREYIVVCQGPADNVNYKVKAHL